MSEWFKEHAWKVCVLQKGTAGSNPALSAEKWRDAKDLTRFLTAFGMTNKEIKLNINKLKK